MFPTQITQLECSFHSWTKGSVTGIGRCLDIETEPSSEKCRVLLA
jgi:hypothetical protein